MSTDLSVNHSHICLCYPWLPAAIQIFFFCFSRIDTFWYPKRNSSSQSSIYLMGTSSDEDKQKSLDASTKHNILNKPLKFWLTFVIAKGCSYQLGKNTHQAIAEPLPMNQVTGFLSQHTSQGKEVCYSEQFHWRDWYQTSWGNGLLANASNLQAG